MVVTAAGTCAAVAGAAAGVELAPGSSSAGASAVTGAGATGAGGAGTGAGAGAGVAGGRRLPGLPFGCAAGRRGAVPVTPRVPPGSEPDGTRWTARTGTKATRRARRVGRARRGERFFVPAARRCDGVAGTPATRRLFAASGSRTPPDSGSRWRRDPLTVSARAANATASRQAPSSAAVSLGRGAVHVAPARRLAAEDPAAEVATLLRRRLVQLQSGGRTVDLVKMDEPRRQPVLRPRPFRRLGWAGLGLLALAGAVAVWLAWPPGGGDRKPVDVDKDATLPAVANRPALFLRPPASRRLREAGGGRPSGSRHY